MFEDTYKTIEKSSEGIFKDKGSKFIALAFPVKSEAEIKEILADLRKKYYDARHHCYAYQLGFDKSAYRVNDDGEPSGTAGKPIYGQILSKDLTNILIVVIRYFGGTLLGVSGLINAYKNAASDALNNNLIITKTINEVYNVNFKYESMNDIMKILKDENTSIISTNFDLDCNIEFFTRKNNSTKIYEKLIKISDTKVKYSRTF